MNSGLDIPDEIRKEFQNMRMKRKHRYIIYQLNEKHDGVCIEKLGARDASFDEFKESIPKNNSR